MNNVKPIAVNSKRRVIPAKVTPDCSNLDKKVWFKLATYIKYSNNLVSAAKKLFVNFNLVIYLFILILILFLIFEKIHQISTRR